MTAPHLRGDHSRCRFPLNTRHSCGDPSAALQGGFAFLGLIDDAGDQLFAAQELHRSGAHADVVAGVLREEDLVARLDPARVGTDRGHDPRAAALVGAGGDDQAAPRPGLRVAGLDQEEVVERFQRDAQVVLVLLLDHSYSLPASTIRARNCWVRGCCGEEKIRAGGPSSRITPSSRKHTRSAMSRANAISCVAISIVIPLAASSRTTFRTSATNSGSSALVISSSSMSFGRSASARTIATRCCCPPERLSGYASRLSSSPKRANSSSARASASARESPSALRGPRVTLPSTLMCGKRLYDWKTIPISRRTRLTSTPSAVISSPSR